MPCVGGPCRSVTGCLSHCLWACTHLGCPQGDLTLIGVGQEAGETVRPPWVQPASAASGGPLGTVCPRPWDFGLAVGGLAGERPASLQPQLRGRGEGTPGTGPKPQAHVLTARGSMQARVTLRGPWGTQPLTGPHSATRRLSDCGACRSGSKGLRHSRYFWLKSGAPGTPSSTRPSGQASISGRHAGGPRAPHRLANQSRPRLIT